MSMTSNLTNLLDTELKLIEVHRTKIRRVHYRDQSLHSNFVPYSYRMFVLEMMRIGIGGQRQP